MKNFLEIFHHVAARCAVIGDSAGRCNVQKQFNDLIQVNISFDLLGIQQTNDNVVGCCFLCVVDVDILVGVVAGLSPFDDSRCISQKMNVGATKEKCKAM